MWRERHTIDRNVNNEFQLMFTELLSWLFAES